MKKQKMEDKSIICKECGKKFLFNISDQEYYHNMEFETPKRCPGCRRKKKERSILFTQGSAGIDC